MNYFIKATDGLQTYDMPGDKQWCIDAAKKLDAEDTGWTHEVVGIAPDGTQTIHYATTLGVVPESETGINHQQYVEGK